MCSSPAESETFFTHPLETVEQIAAARVELLEYAATSRMEPRAVSICLAVLSRMREDLEHPTWNAAIDAAAGIASRTVCSLTPCQREDCPGCAMATQIGEQIRALRK